MTSHARQRAESRDNDANPPRRDPAIAPWTTPYLADAIEALRAEGEYVPEELIAHLSPLTRRLGAGELSGSVHVDPANDRPLDNRRSLRSGADEGVEAA